MISILYAVGLLLWAVVTIGFFVGLAIKAFTGLLIFLAYAYDFWLRITGKKSEFA